MRVTDEMVQAALDAIRDHEMRVFGEIKTKTNGARFECMRVALSAALSHAAGQEAEQRPTNAPETGEWYWLEDGDLFHSQASMNGQHLGRYYRDDGRGWEDVRKSEKLPPAPPTTSAEVGRDAEMFAWLRDNAEIDSTYFDVVKLSFPCDIDGFNTLDEAVAAAMAASSRRQGD